MSQINAQNVDTASPPFQEDGVVIVELADELQIRKQTIFKILKRLGIHTAKRRDVNRRGQMVSIISSAEAEVVREELRRNNKGDASIGDSPYISEDFGVFYVVQLEPKHDPQRLKVGFTTDIEGRLRHHRCSAPFAQCIRTWMCRRTWERTVIDCVTVGAEQLHTEIFRVGSIEMVVDRANKFFNLMPNIFEAPNGDLADNALAEVAV